MATYYISPVGNDTTGNGSSSTPWLTLSKAYTASTTGDTIIVNDGTYTFANATMSDRTIQAAHNGLAIFDGASGNVSWKITNGTFICQGLVFQNIVKSSSLPIFNWDSPSTAPVTITFSACKFKSLTAAEALFGYINSSVSFQLTLTMQNCEFNDPQFTGTHKALVVLRAIYSGSFAFIGNTVAIRSATNTPTEIFKSYTFAWGVTVKNSIFYNSSGNTVNSVSGSVTVTATYSDFYLITSNPTGTGVVTSDPLFVDAAGGNFRLRPTSPCLNTGSAV